jgi:hypothetical protein
LANTLDGSQGEGGGQILRSALALSLVTGRPFRITRIRARRPKPGLMRQHLACVEAAARIGSATVDGAALGSTELTFEPGAVVAGNHEFKIGSAGSTMLLLQTILPPLLLAGQPSEIVLEGGTHNPFAPPFPFIEAAFLPLLRRMGFRVDAVLERPASIRTAADAATCGSSRWSADLQIGPARMRWVPVPSRSSALRGCGDWICWRVAAEVTRRIPKPIGTGRSPSPRPSPHRMGRGWPKVG